MPKKTAIILALIWTVFIIYMCLKTPGVATQLFPNIDKVVHFTFYFIFVILWYRFLAVKNQNSKINIICLFLSSVLFGILIEFCQYWFTKSRMAEGLDVVANTIGSIVGIALSVNIFKIKEKA